MKLINVIILCTIFFSTASMASIIGPPRSEIYGKDNVKKADVKIVEVMASSSGQAIHKLYELQLKSLIGDGYTESTRENVWIPLVVNPRFTAAESALSEQPQYFDLAKIYRSGLNLSYVYSYDRNGTPTATIIAKKGYSRKNGNGYDRVELQLTIEVGIGDNAEQVFKLVAVKSIYDYVEPIEEGVGSSGGG